jgi:hypothetical protein
MDLIVGAWRNALTTEDLSTVQAVEMRADQGFRLVPNESVLVQLAHALDGYDDFAASLLNEDAPKPKGK